MPEMHEVQRIVIFFTIPLVICALAAAAIFCLRPSVTNKDNSLEKLLDSRNDKERTEKLMKNKNKVLAEAIEAGDDDLVDDLEMAHAAQPTVKKRAPQKPRTAQATKRAAPAPASQQELDMEPPAGYQPHWGDDDDDIPEMHMRADNHPPVTQAA